MQTKYPVRITSWEPADRTHLLTKPSILLTTYRGWNYSKGTLKEHFNQRERTKTAKSEPSTQLAHLMLRQNDLARPHHASLLKNTTIKTDFRRCHPQLRAYWNLIHRSNYILRKGQFLFRCQLLLHQAWNHHFVIGHRPKASSIMKELILELNLRLMIVMPKWQEPTLPSKEKWSNNQVQSQDRARAEPHQDWIEAKVENNDFKM